jgi:GNAT superfamily N-acetyltransferase
MAWVVVEAWQTDYRGLVADDILDGLNADWRAQKWREQMRDREWDHDFYVAELDGKVVGLATIGARRKGPLRYPGEVHAMYVHPSAQRRGIGRALFQVACVGLLERGFRALLIWTLAENPKSCGFYQAMGGKQVDDTMLTIGHQTVPEAAFGWDQIPGFELAEHCPLR